MPYIFVTWLQRAWTDQREYATCQPVIAYDVVTFGPRPRLFQR